MRNLNARNLQLMLLASAAPMATSVQAQDASSRDEIVVTGARKVGENVQDVPLTVNVLSGSALDKKGVQNLSDLSGLAPNLIWDNRAGTVRNRITIRGISSNENNTGFDSGVGIYVDDVYLVNGLSFNQALLDIEQVEVLKGPQGTLFGRNTTAGAISITTKRPSVAESFADAEVAFGNYDFFQTRVAGNYAINDTMAFRLSTLFRDRKGYALNIVDGSRANAEHSWGGRLQFLYEPGNDFNLLLTGDFSRSDAVQEAPECTQFPPNPVGAPPSLCMSGTNNDYVLEASPPNRTTRETWGVAANANWSPGNIGTLTSVTAYRELEAQTDQDQDGLTPDIVHSGFNVPDSWQFSQELRFATPQENDLRAVFGAYYMHEQKDSLTPFFQDATPLFGPGPWPVITQTTYVQKTDSYALFGQGQWNITPRFVAEVGLRYSIDDKSTFYTEEIIEAPITDPNGCAAVLITVCPFGPFSGSENWDALSGTASLSYDLADNLLVYGRYSRGYKSGGWQGNQNAGPASMPPVGPEVPFDPEYVNSYEAGFKFENEEASLRLNGSGFFMQYTDMQTRIFIVGTGQQPVFNVGKAKVVGAELELNWAPLDDLQFDAGVGYQDTEVTEMDPASVPAAFAPFLPATGTELIMAPHWTSSMTGTYSKALGHGISAILTGTGAYKGNMFFNASNSFQERGYWTVRARAGLEFDDGQWGIYATGLNLTDKNRLGFGQAVGPQQGFRIGFPIAPRTWQVELRVRY